MRGNPSRTRPASTHKGSRTPAAEGQPTDQRREARSRRKHNRVGGKSYLRTLMVVSSVNFVFRRVPDNCCCIRPEYLIGVGRAGGGFCSQGYRLFVDTSLLCISKSNR